MMIMGNFKKLYVGAIESEVEAALLYDRVAILSHGLKVNNSILRPLTLLCRLKPTMTTQRQRY